MYCYRYKVTHGPFKRSTGDIVRQSTGKFQVSKEYTKKEAQELITKMSHNRLHNVTILELELLDKRID